MSEHKHGYVGKRPLAVVLGVGAILLAATGLVLAFGLASRTTASFVFIGIAAGLAPVIGILLLLLALETDLNGGGAGADSAH